MTAPPVQAGSRSLTDSTLAETGGVLVMTPNAGDGSGDYRSDEVYAVTNSQVSLEIIDTFDPATTAQLIFAVSRPNQANIDLRISNGTLYVETIVLAGGYDQKAAIAYDPVAHRFLRIRFDAATAYAEASADGSTWTGLTPFAPPFSMDYVEVLISFDAMGNPTPGHVSVDNLNGAGDGSLVNCPISGIADDFSDNVVGPLWAKSFAGTDETFSESGGDAVLTIADNTGGGAGFYSTNHYDMRGMSVTADIGQVLNTDFSTDSTLRLINASKEVAFIVNEGTMTVQLTQPAEITLVSVTYDAASMHCWRFRHASDTLFLETAALPCSTFAPLTQLSDFDCSSVSLIMFAQAFNPVADPGSMHIESITVP